MKYELQQYEAEYETSWLRCRVLSFLETAYYDDVLQKKPQYTNQSDEWIALSGDHVIGLIDIEYEEAPGTVGTSKEFLSGMIWNIAVHPDYQGQGIGRVLLGKAEQLAVKKGIQRLEAWTRDDASVNDWYQRQGFAISQSYLHVYMNQKEARDVFHSNEAGFTLVGGFAHYQGRETDRVKERFSRVYDCHCYEKLL